MIRRFWRWLVGWDDQSLKGLIGSDKKPEYPDEMGYPTFGEQWAAKGGPLPPGTAYLPSGVIVRNR